MDVLGITKDEQNINNDYIFYCIKEVLELIQLNQLILGQILLS